MSWLEQTLADFGRQIGLGELRFSAEGVAQLSLAQGGLLGFEQVDGEVLVYLARSLGFEAAPAYERALRLCDFREKAPWPLQAGLRGERELVLLARVPERQFTLPALEQTIDLLTRLHRQVREG